MADTAVKTPNKRKSLMANKGGSVKKPKVEVATPKKTPMKPTNSPKQPNSNKKNKDAKGTPNAPKDPQAKKVKPFKGTNDIKTPKKAAAAGTTEDTVKKPRKHRKPFQTAKTEPKLLTIADLHKDELIKKNQKRYVLFVGNIPYDTAKQDLQTHFEKCGEIKHIRIPTEKKSNKPRGFGYVEVTDEETYQKCLSLHHTFMKGRRINVLYTAGGKKQGEEKKKETKIKNLKLHAMRKQGQLLGSKKETQKRSFRRKKQNQSQSNKFDA